MAGDVEESGRLGRVLLKLSGEALMGDAGFGIDPARIDACARDVQALVDAGTEVAIVVGGGNFFRGVSDAAAGMDRAVADQVGMLATILNALPLEAALVRAGVPATTMTAGEVSGVATRFDRQRAIELLGEGRVVISAQGTGCPYFTTDTAAALRALELGVDALLMAKHGVDGVYDADPRTTPDATRIERISPREAIARDLRVMDHAALALCADNGLPLYVFDMDDPTAAARLVRGERVGTEIRA